MSTIMDHSGQTTVLALGIAQTAPATAFAASANAIGLLGSFMTSSNTTSNILFAAQDTALGRRRRRRHRRRHAAAAVIEAPRGTAGAG
jgi:L-lactate permease